MWETHALLFPILHCEGDTLFFRESECRKYVDDEDNYTVF